MAITFDAQSASSDGSSTSNTLTQSHTSTGLNLILLAYVKVPNGRSITSVTYNGVSMSLQQLGTHLGHYDIALYYLNNPATGAHNLTLTISGNDAMELIGMSYTNVDQISPFESSSNNTTNSANSFTVGPGTNNTNNAMNTYGFSWDGTSVSSPSFTPGAGQTDRSQTTLSNNNGFLGGEQPLATAGSYSFSETMSGGGTGALHFLSAILKPFNSVDALFFAGD